MKITYQEYRKILEDPDSDDELILSYSIVEKGANAFQFTVRPDPKKVKMTEEDLLLEDAMAIGNNIERFRRRVRFNRRKVLQPDLPVLVSEGDSWWQFPFIVKDVIDQLGDEYLIWSAGAAGDTAQNMVFGGVGPKRTEYMLALDDQKKHVKGFLFSAAGNDVIGEDPITNEAVLLAMLRPFNGNTNDITGHIDLVLLGEKLAFLKKAYMTVIKNIRARPEYRKLPIFIHGYDYVFPYPWGSDDPRDPKHADPDNWLGRPLAAKNINDKNHRRAILSFLINALYDMLGDIANDPSVKNVWLVDCRGAMPNVKDWIDEIHGTSKGFKKVSKRFRKAIAEALATS